MISEAIPKIVRQPSVRYHRDSELHNIFWMTIVARHAPPQTAPPTAPAAIDDDTGMVRIDASFPNQMRNRRWPRRVRQRFTRENAGTDEARIAIAHSEDELMRSVRVASDEMDSGSSVEGDVARGVLSVTDSILDSDISLWWVIISTM